MKAKMLKLAGVKSEKEFYKKFPTEEAFMAKHGKAFKKAQIGAYIGGDQDKGYQPIDINQAYDSADMMITGSTNKMRQDTAYKQAQLDASKKGSGGGGIGDALGQILGSEEGMSAIASAFGGARRGTKIKKAFGGNTIGGKTPPQPTAYDNDDDYRAAANAYYTSTPNSAGGATAASGKKDSSKLMGTLKKMAPGAGQLIQGIDMIGQQKEALQSAEQMRDLSALTLQAANIRPEETQRRYLRPEDNVNTGEEFFPIYGVGTNPLARNGTEIANTFAPNTIYDDLGYEPLYDSERVKQFFTGGKMRKAEDGDWLAGSDAYKFAKAGGGNMGSQLVTGTMGESAGGTIGGSIGKMAGTALGGPVGGMIGEVGGQLIGGLIDKNPQKIKAAKAATDRNMMAMALGKGFQGAQQQYSSFMENGGNVNPQIISKFGNYSLQELLAEDPTMDTLRAGGHLKEYTEPSARALQTYEQGGDLQTHWGGYAEPMSTNPYLPGDGETVMFRGQSHDESDGQGNTGIGITYGENPVEVERGEPAVKLRDGGGDESLVVFGNLKVPNAFVPILGEEAKGKKFKNYVADLSKKEARQNKIVDKSSKGLESLDIDTPFDKLTLDSYKANIMGANMKLKSIADKKMDASALQSAMNDTIEMFDMEAGDDGLIKARKGMKIPKADNGITIGDKEIARLKKMYEVAEKQQTGPAVTAFQKEMHKLAPDVAREVLSKYDLTRKGKEKGLKKTDLASNVDKYFGPRTKEYMSAFENKYAKKASTIDDTFTGNLNTSPEEVMSGTSDEVVVKGVRKKKPEGNKKDNSLLMDMLNQVLPYVRPTDAGTLDPNETLGEMYAMSQNQLEPVQAQLYQPQLDVPYDISLQDILNENQADFRSQQRMVGYNPAAQGMLNAQKYAANQKVLGEQFRMNQGQRQQVYNQNRAALNDARLKNLSILDTQYGRQAAAKSNTKATMQAALNSIASKYAQNKLANRTLQTYENLYNFRYDNKGRAINMNPLVNWQAIIDNASSKDLDSMLTKLEEKTGKKKTEASRNGSIVKALKNL